MTDVTIIGGGIVGLGAAHALLERGVTSLRVIEKEVGLAHHQSSHNSGVLHAGLQYEPGSMKAKLARSGIRRMVEFCQEHHIGHDVCGKLVVARSASEMSRLDAMLERGRANGLAGLRTIGPEEAREIEPHVECAAAIVVPEEGIADFPGVCRALEGILRRHDVEILTGAEVRAMRRAASEWTIETTAGSVATRVVVTCGGLFADRLTRMAGSDPRCRIVPFRGEYFRLREDREHLVRHLIYPLPEPGFPFLGVHFTRRVGGGIDAGPNAVLAFAREGYSRSTVDVRDVADALGWPGLWRFILDHPSMVARELGQSFSKSRFVSALQTLIPEIQIDDLVHGHAGVRAQAMDSRGRLIHDFVWSESDGAVHVVNAPSPAATASLAIGDEIATRVLAQLGR
ncbi:MAG: L-2-hydroxyglutarate oxidase [Gemmatimonadota bacterium]